jgi:hypothetical protein
LAFGVRRSAFGVRRSAFGVRRSAFGVRRSAFGVRRSAFGVRRILQTDSRPKVTINRHSHDMLGALRTKCIDILFTDERTVRKVLMAADAA